MKWDVLAIGVDNYFDQSGHVLVERSMAYGASDAEKVFRTFQRVFDVRNGCLISDAPISKVRPTRANILLKLQEFSKLPNDDARPLIIYFAGHGTDVARILHLCPSDFEERIARHSAIDLALVCDLIGERNGRKVLVLDCCRANADREGEEPVGRPQCYVPVSDELSVLMSCATGQRSFELEDGPCGSGGIFTGFFLQALGDAMAGSKDGFTALHEVFLSTREKTVEFTFKKYGFVRQRPVALGSDIDSFYIGGREQKRRNPRRRQK